MYHILLQKKYREARTQKIIVKYFVTDLLHSK